jgi:hypothetical protein
MATSKPLSMAQTGSNFENFNFFVVFSAYRVQKSIMSNLSHTNATLYAKKAYLCRKWYAIIFENRFHLPK